MAQIIYEATSVLLGFGSFLIFVLAVSISSRG